MSTTIRRVPNLVTAGLLAAAVLIGTRPANAQGGVWKRIKQEAASKIIARKLKTDSTLVTRAGTAVDSTLGKTGRGVDTLVSKTANATDTLLNRSERGVKGLVAGARPGDDAGARLAADFADDGRVVLGDLRFKSDDALDPASRETVDALAKLLASTTGAFLVEGHVVAGGGTAKEQARSEAHAKAVKAALVAQGVDATRLFTMGFGATRPGAPGTPAGHDRIEVARMQ